MNKTLLLSPKIQDVSSSNICAFVRIMRNLALNIPNCQIVNNSDYLKEECIKDVGSIVYVYSSFYSEFQKIIEFMERYPHAKLFWLTNESSLFLNSSIRKYFKQRGFEVITNINDGYSKEILDSNRIHVVNLNTTSYNEYSKYPKINDRPYDLIYYGSFKPGRMKYVNEYFTNEHLSTSIKNKKMFEIHGYRGKFIESLKIGKHGSSLFSFKASVYIEDEASHNSKYCFLSDRFYECLSSGVVLFFDKTCVNTIKKSEYDIPDYFIVSNKQELKQKLLEICKDSNLVNNYFQSIIPQVKKQVDTMYRDFQNAVC